MTIPASLRTLWRDTHPAEMALSEAGEPHHPLSALAAGSTTPSNSIQAGRSGHEWPRDGAGHFPSVRYRGFVLIPQADLTWLIRPERSPMRILPFRAPASSLSDVKALVDWRLAQHEAR